MNISTSTVVTDRENKLGNHKKIITYFKVFSGMSLQKPLSSSISSNHALQCCVLLDNYTANTHCSLKFTNNKTS